MNQRDQRVVGRSLIAWCVVLPFVLAMIASAVLGESTNVVWDSDLPVLSYTNARMEEVFADIERYSKEITPDQHGIRILWPGWPGLGTFSGSTSNMTLHTFFRCVGKTFFYRDVAIVMNATDRPAVGMAGVFGKCVDFDTGQPITNANFETCSMPIALKSQNVTFWLEVPYNPPTRSVAAPDGTFALAVPYFAKWAIFYSDLNSEPLALFLGPADTPVTAFKASAPGYEPETNQVDVYDLSVPILIKLRKAQDGP